MYADKLDETVNEYKSTYHKLHEICENMGFRWFLFSCIRTESLYWRIRVRENP